MKDGRKKAKPHRLREAMPEQAAAVMRDDYLDPFGAQDKSGRVYLDSKLPRIGTSKR